MRQVSIRQFRANMAKELSDLPFELVKNGRRIAVVSDGVYTIEPKESVVYTNKPETCTQTFRPYGKLAQLSEGRKKHG